MARRSRDVYVYFDNDAKVRAPPDALGLAQRLGVAVSHSAPLHPDIQVRSGLKK